MVGSARLACVRGTRHRQGDGVIGIYKNRGIVGCPRHRKDGNGRRGPNRQNRGCHKAQNIG